MILLVFVLSAVLLSAFVLTAKINDINSEWHQTNKTIMAKNNALFQINRHFGYGGFIHHFKNLVLRQEQHYSISAEQSMLQTEQAIISYEALIEADTEALLLAQFKQTAELYKQKLLSIQTALSSNKQNIHQLDETVRVDDTLATSALDILSLQIADNNKKSIALFNHQYQSINKTNQLQLIVIIPLILLAGAMLAFYAIRVTRAYSELQTIFNVSPDALIVLGLDGRIIRANPKACDVFGYSLDEFQKIQVESLVPIEHRGGHQNTRVNFQQQNNNRDITSEHAEVKAINKSGDMFPVEITLATYGEQGSQKTIANIKDLRQYKNLEALSTTDHLTGIANRLKIDDILDSEINRAKRFGQPLSFILLDIDYFKSVNDNYGHQEGDAVLQALACLLRTRTRKIDTCGRWGGEEFCIICPGTKASEAYQLADDLREQIATTSFGKLEHITASFGVANFEHDQDSFQDLVHRTDIALYQSKQYGRNRVTLAN